VNRIGKVFAASIIAFVLKLTAAQGQSCVAHACAMQQSPVGNQAAPQDEPPPLTSNRPGIADSEALVPSGAFQFEAGVQDQDAPSGDDRRWTQTWGQLTVRYGMTSRVELFAGWDGLSLNRVLLEGESRIVAGGNDVRVGTKLAILMEDAHGLTVTIAPAWSFPVGSEAFTSNSNDPSFRVLWARSLRRDWSVSGNVLFRRTTDAIGRYWDNGVMVGLTRALTRHLSAFAEASNVILADRPDALTIDAGVAWIAGTDLQFDASVGRTLFHRGDDWFVSAGITFRQR
jgi:hypothetical protein